MANSTGVLCGAGFEGPAEAMYLGKKVMVVPMLAQYEQHCNAAGAATMGATVIKTLEEKNYGIIKDWLANGNHLHVNYPEITASVVEKLIKEHTPNHYEIYNKQKQTLPVI